MSSISPQLIEQCRAKLLERKSELLNRARAMRSDYLNRDKGGDEADQCDQIIAENQFVQAQTRVRMEVLEIEQALARIQQGSFGICEETFEPIETNRLLAIPWTRLSIEGAEMREAVNKRFAR